MKILFHSGSGNTDRPNRWRTINKLFSDLGESLIDLGHSCWMMYHEEAEIPDNNYRTVKRKSSVVDVDFIDHINPDVCITWNGNSDGDRIFINHVGNEKMIYGELGFFGHYNKTCYFDGSGVNTRHSIIGEKFDLGNYSEEDEKICNDLIKKFMKPRIVNEPYIFIPLQDETDTQIVQYSPFKTMDEFIHHVADIFKNDDRLILYKTHPRASSEITITDEKFVKVDKDVHHYIPYADLVFGLNSTVMVETLIYHQRISTYGCGISSRHFENDTERKMFIAEMYRRQLTWDDLKDKEIIERSYFYELLKSYINK